MTTQDDLDQLVRDRLHADAAGRAPAGLLDAAMTRIATTSQRRGRVSRTAGGRLLAAAAVVLLAVVAGAQLAGLIQRPAGTGESPSPTASPAVTGSPAPSTSPTPTPGTPPPSPPPGAADDLVFRVVAGGGGPTNATHRLPWAALMADGTLIWQPETPPTTDVGPLVMRRLTPEGLADLTERIFGTGLFEANADYELERRPDAAEPPGRGVVAYQFTAAQGDGEAVVRSVQWLGDEEESTYYQPAPERRALDELANALRDPESLLGPEAWAGPAEPYASADYQLVLIPYRDGGQYDTSDASQIPWPFEGPLDMFGEALEGVPVSRCGAISHEAAEAITGALEAAGFEGVGLDRATVAALDWAEGNGRVDLFLLPRMPDGYPECADQASGPPA